MSTRAHSNVRTFRQLSPAEADDLAQGRAALRMLGQILSAVEASNSDQERIVPHCRVSDLTPPHGPFSKATVNCYIKNGRLDSILLGGMRLISIESVNELLQTAELWTPRDKDG